MESPKQSYRATTEKNEMKARYSDDENDNDENMLILDMIDNQHVENDS